MIQHPLTSRMTGALPVFAQGALRAATALVMAAAMALPPAAASAQGGRSFAVVRDAEAEALIQEYLRPILKAAGVRQPDVQLIPSQQFNAFVTGRNNMFINVGTIIMSETPNELIGVLAHETAHMADDDVAQMTQAMEEAKFGMLLAGIAGIGAAAAGAATGSSEMGQAGAGVVSGAFGVAQRGLLRFQRSQESAADRAAVRFLNATGQSPRGMLNTLRRLADDNLFTSQGVNPYTQTHPLPRERVSEVEALVAQSKFANVEDSPALRVRHDLLRAKLVGFTWTPLNINRRYPISDNSLPARYARAILAYRTGQPAAAVKAIDDLIRGSPNNPYFHELKGQALLETGNPKAALAPLRRAVSLAPNAGIIKIMLGQALVAVGDRASAQEAIKLLSGSLQRDPDIVAGYRALARAHALDNDQAMAQLATAQGLFAEGNFKEARIQAERAQAKLKRGSPAWLRADDIVTYKPSR